MLDDDLLDDETVVDVVDSPLFVVRFGRPAADVDKDETFVLRGMLSIDDCEDAVKSNDIMSLITTLTTSLPTHSFEVLDGNV